MKSSVAEIPTIIGTLFDGGYYAGRINVDGEVYAILVAPKAEGEHKDTKWHTKYDSVEGAKSYFDGLANAHHEEAKRCWTNCWSEQLED